MRKRMSKLAALCAAGVVLIMGYSLPVMAGELESVAAVQERAGGITGLVQKNDGWYYYENGVWVRDKYDIVEFNGGKFLVANGKLVKKSGLTECKGVWYFLSEGQVQNQYTGLAEYDGEWFYIENGVLAESFNGIQYYDGGQFLIAVGRILYNYSGLFQNTDGVWYYISCGQVQNQYTGLAEYDGEWFYIERGILNQSYSGYVAYDGSIFYVENGHVSQDSTKKNIYQIAVNNRNVYASDIAVVHSYVNQYRVENGMFALELDETLCVAACLRAQEMADNHVFSHTRPNGTSCFTVFEELGIQRGYGGENIAMGYRTAAEVSKGWYQSPGHRANMLNGSFKKIGIGVAADAGGTKYWVQLFTD